MGLLIVLIGAESGGLLASSISKRCASVVSTVGRLDLGVESDLSSRCRLFSGADCGLLHIASSILIPTLVLSADRQMFQSDGFRVTRETKDMNGSTVYNEQCVSNIPPSGAAEKFNYS